MRYRMHLQLEKSLQSNTVDAYLSDVNKLVDFLGGDEKALGATLEDLRLFLASLADVGINARSQARIISSLRSFYAFMKLDGFIENDPAELLRSPKIGMRLPDVLTLQEIDDIINAVDLSKREGQRNRAILEVLYSCGLRVSEVCGLRSCKDTASGYSAASELEGILCNMKTILTILLFTSLLLLCYS